MPNSLIFAVILAVWAAYLIQHWIRRRDHVATARSVDRFSEAMRVLERRQSLPRADVTPPAPRSYSLSLTRPAHPDVVVKRAGPGVVATAPRRSTPRLRKPPAAVVRATLLLLGIVSLIAGVTPWLTGQAPWWSAAAGAGGLLLALTLVRVSVGRAQRRATSPVRARATNARAARPRRAHQPSVAPPRRAHEPSVARRRGAAERTRALPARTEHTASSTELVADSAELFEQPVHVPAEVELYVVAVHEAGPDTQQSVGLPVVGQAETAPAREDQVQELEGTWAPVAVPPPTYTLKAKASRRPASPQPAAPEETGPVLSGTVEVDGLPFDGNAMAFDEEFEDLPPVHSVG